MPTAAAAVKFNDARDITGIGVGVVNPLYLFHCEKCHQPLLIALVWERERPEQLIDPTIREVKAVAELGNVLGPKIKTVVVLATPDRDASDRHDQGVAIAQVQVYTPGKSQRPTLTEKDVYRKLLQIAEQHNAREHSP